MVTLNLMYLANGTACLSLLGGFPGRWSGFGAAVFLPGGATVPGPPDARDAGARPVLVTLGGGGGYCGDAPRCRGRAGSGGHWWEAKFWPQLRGTANEAQMNIRRI